MSKKTVSEIVAQGHDYVITVKGNAKRLHQEILAGQDKPPLSAWSWSQTGHGHDSDCRLKMWEASDEVKAQWPGSRYVITVRRQGERDGNWIDNTTCYISGAEAKACRQASLIRGHRRIENNLHWVKDVVMNEDDCGIPDVNAAATLGIFRDIAFNLLVFQGYNSISTGMGAMGERIPHLWNIMTASMEQLLKYQELARTKKIAKRRKEKRNQNVKRL